MLDLAVVNREETFERIRDPLADRGVRVRHLPARGRTIPLDPAEWTPGGAALPDGSTDVDGDGDAGGGADAPPTDEALGPAGGEAFDVGLVYPSRLMEGGAIDALLSVPWVNDRAAVVTSRNKGGVVATLGGAGLPVPKTVMVSHPVTTEELVAVFERFDPPVVVKPNSTTRGRGVAKATDLDSFLGVVDYLDLVHDYRATGDKSFLVQEYLPDATDYRVMVLDGEYAGAVERRHPAAEGAAGRWKHNVHRGAEAAGVALPDDLRRLAERAAAVVDVPLLGVDLLVTDDRAVVAETAARPTIDDASKYEDGFYDRLAALIRATATGRERSDGDGA